MQLMAYWLVYQVIIYPLGLILAVSVLRSARCFMSNDDYNIFFVFQRLVSSEGPRWPCSDSENTHFSARQTCQLRHDCVQDLPSQTCQ